ncbi:MAG: FAD-binding oxidoreductase, partial [Acidimicrobiia bacterium]
MDDLQSVLGADRARAEPLELALYQRDAGVDRGTAAAVCFPHTGEELAAAVRIAAQHDRPFVARGSGTGLAGGATPVGDPLVIVT